MSQMLAAVTASSPRRVAAIAVLALLALPGIAHAGTLSSSGGVLTYTGGDAVDNNVSATHQGDPAFVRIVDVAEDISTASAPECVPNDEGLGVICPTPSRLVVNSGGGNDSFTDNSIFGDPVAFPIEVNGGTGDDEINSGNGPDALAGGAGNDTIGGDGGDDVVAGEDGADKLAGGEGQDQLAGGAGADGLTGEAGNDVVRGGDGDDDLDFSPLYALDGADVFEGGSGNDSVGYFGRTASVSINLDGQANDGQAGEGDNIGADIEVVDGGDAADVLVGTEGANGLAGRGGDDRISGLGGDDVLYGDTGNDDIDGGGGGDVLDGGCQDDTITGGPGVDSLNSDGTCADPALRGQNDVLRARDGTRDALVLCTVSGPPGDTAIVDPSDPALGPDSGPGSGACRTVDVGGAIDTDTVAPNMSRVSARALSRGRLTLRYRLSEAATVTLKLQKRSGRSWRSVRGQVRKRAKAGTNVLKFSGRLAGKRVRPGRYRLVLTAVDGAGNRSPAKRLVVLLRR